MQIEMGNENEAVIGRVYKEAPSFQLLHELLHECATTKSHYIPSFQ